jgi:hypothetical protein
LFRCRIVEEAKFGENLAGPGGIELRMAKSKSARLFNDFEGYLKKIPLAFSLAWQLFPNKEAAPAGGISLAKSEATGCAP